MKRALAVIGLLATLTLSAFAAQPSVLKATIPFEFTAGSNTLPAGTYEFSVVQERTMVSLRNMATEKIVFVPIITALAVSPGSEAKVTFDAIGDTKALEAVWPADNDGVLLRTTRGKHSHELVKAAAKE
jgi:hypothetical protein